MSASIFYNEETGQLRAMWRLLCFIGSAYCLAYLMTQGLRMVTFASQWSATVMYAWILPLALLGAHAFCLRVVDKQPWSFVGLDRAALRPNVVLGATLLGALAIAVPTAVLLMAQQYALVPAADGSWLAATLRTTLILIPAALWEELLFRGYPFAVLRSAMGWKGALFASSIVFGVVHLNNGGAAAQNIIIVTVAGFLLGMIVLATRSLYAAWATHLAWNWMMACAFHVSVSGNPFERPDYELIARGPTWLTGGAWGPEGGLGAGLGLFIAVFYVYGRYLKRWSAREA